MVESDRVGGVARISLPASGEKGAPWITLESSFNINSEENTPEGRKSKRKEGWAEVQEDLGTQLSETLADLKRQMGGK